jgi:hypothetical protein
MPDKPYLKWPLFRCSSLAGFGCSVTFRRGDLPKLFGGVEFTQHTLRFAWHLTSVAWMGFAGLLTILASAPDGTGRTQARVISVTFALSRVGTRWVQGAPPILDRVPRHLRLGVARGAVSIGVCHTLRGGGTDVGRAKQRSNKRMQLTKPAQAMELRS